MEDTLFKMKWRTDIDICHTIEFGKQKGDKYRNTGKEYKWLIHIQSLSVNPWESPPSVETKEILLKIMRAGWEFNSMVECFPSMCKALDLILSITHTQK